MALDVNPQDEGVLFFFVFLRRLVELMDSTALNDRMEAFSLAKQFDIQQHDTKVTTFVKGLKDEVFRSRVRELLNGTPHEVIQRINQVLLAPDPPTNPSGEPSS